MPSSKNYKRDYKQENKYKSTPAQIHARVLRNAARRDALKAGQVHKGDGKEVDHKVPLSKGGSNAASNRRIVSAHTNDSYARTSSGAMVFRNGKQVKRKAK